MNTINSKKLGFAIGMVGVILYLGCICLMLIAGQSGATWFFNSIMHGLDVSSISQMNVPIGQSIVGIIITFGLGWMSGYLIGMFYNWGSIK